jgi:hypothetical protein
MPLGFDTAATLARVCIVDFALVATLVTLLEAGAAADGDADPETKTPPVLAAAAGELAVTVVVAVVMVTTYTVLTAGGLMVTVTVFSTAATFTVTVTKPEGCCVAFLVDADAFVFVDVLRVVGAAEADARAEVARGAEAREVAWAFPGWTTPMLSGATCGSAVGFTRNAVEARDSMATESTLSPLCTAVNFPATATGEETRSISMQAVYDWFLATLPLVNSVGHSQTQ